MESDRIETNLGPILDQDLEPEQETVPKQPKRRFVGRKTADQYSQKVDKNGGIEESSSSLQGTVCLPKTSDVGLMKYSFSASPDSPCPKQHPTRDPQRCGHCFCNCTPPLELCIRNSKNDPPRSHVRRTESRPPVSGRSPPLRYHHLRHTHPLLS
jgi:hypothetical protein